MGTQEQFPKAPRDQKHSLCTPRIITFLVDIIYLLNPFTEKHVLANLKSTRAHLKLEVTHTCLYFRPIFWPKPCTVTVQSQTSDWQTVKMDLQLYWFLLSVVVFWKKWSKLQDYKNYTSKWLKYPSQRFLDW